MIIRNLELTVNDDRATLNEEVVIYLGDNGICLHVALKQVKYKFNTQMVCSFEAIEYCDSCEVIIQKPNEEIFIIPKTEVINNLVHVYIDSTWTDTLSELGEHKMQIILYDKNNSRITLPSVSITVLRPLLFNTGTDILTEDGIDLLNENRASGIRISELEETSIGNGYVPIVVGGKTRKYELDVNSFAEVEHSHEEYLVESDIENFVTQSELEEAIGNIDIDVDIDTSSLATKEELNTALSSKADKEHTHDNYATENFVKNEIAKAQLNGEGEIDLSGFATKDELDAKADKEHTHSQYLTEHQDISHLVSEDELTTELSSKADTTHTHSEYLTEHQSLNHLATKTELTTGLSSKANKEHTHTGMLISSTIFKIEVVDELPTIQETGTLYIVKGSGDNSGDNSGNNGDNTEGYPYSDCDTVVKYKLHESNNYIILNKIDYSKPCYINGVEIESVDGISIEYTFTLDNSNNDTEYITLKLINLKPSPVGLLTEFPHIAIIEQMRIPTLNNLNKLFYGAFREHYYKDTYSWQPQYFEFHPNPTNMSNMFESCYYLTDEMFNQLMPYFPNTSQVINMNSMFRSCLRLTSLGYLLSNFDTSSVTDMSYMFYHCASLTSLDLSNWDTSKVADMSAMFSVCESLTSLDLSNFDTGRVTNMTSMFSNCSALTSLDLSNFDTSNVTHVRYMFAYCSALTSLDLSNFDTSRLTNMGNMFEDCTSLTSLDLSSFDTSKVVSANDMFKGVKNCTIYIGDGWTLDTTFLAYGGTNLTFIRV